MSERERVPDRVRCVVCSHFRGSHDGGLPHKCFAPDCDCPYYMPPAGTTQESKA